MEKNIDEIDKENIPKHIAVIMDGNGRWAKKQGEKRIFGHQNAIKAVRDATEGCAELGVEHLTLYAFSTENWGRPSDEVNALMELLVHTIKQESETLMKNNVKLGAIGATDTLPENCLNELHEAIDATKDNTGLNLYLALSYSGKWDLIKAVKSLAEEVKNDKLSIEDISEQKIDNFLSTKGIPDPELMIRTSGEKRISNFLLWQLAYAELYFTDVLWPDFRKKDLYDAISEFQHRDRRFGKV